METVETLELVTILHNVIAAQYLAKPYWAAIIYTLKLKQYNAGLILIFEAETSIMISPFAVRLTKGADLKKEIKRLVTLHGIEAGTIASCVGCVSQLSLRLAGANDTLSITGPHEIVSVMGTLTPHHQHIHISLANKKGQVIGGHLLEGTIIDTTAELVVLSYDNLAFSRKDDPSTGYSELVIQDK